MDKKKIIMLLGISAGLIIIIGLGAGGYWYWSQQTANSQPLETNQNVAEANTNSVITDVNASANTNIDAPVNTEVPPVEMPAVDDAVYLNQLAKNFVERYGSYSNQNDFENLKDLKIYMTDRLIKQVDQTILDSQPDSQSEQEYYGITTKVVSVDQLQLDSAEGTAEHRLATRRTEASSLTARGKVFTQNCQLKFKRVDTQWKIDSLTWL